MSDIKDGSIAHGDCRNYAWDARGQRLVLVSDGGIFAREMPREQGGRWISLNGDYTSMELLSAHYEPRTGRFVVGAQDNCAQVLPEHATHVIMRSTHRYGVPTSKVTPASRNRVLVYAMTEHGVLARQSKCNP